MTEDQVRQLLDAELQRQNARIEKEVRLRAEHLACEILRQHDRNCAGERNEAIAEAVHLAGIAFTRSVYSWLKPLLDGDEHARQLAENFAVAMAATLAMEATPTPQAERKARDAILRVMNGPPA
jgi:hypothetical protein